MKDNDGSKKHRFFKIPQTKEVIKTNFILAGGLVLILIGMIFSILRIFDGSEITVFKPVLFLFLGEIFLFISFAFNKSAVWFYLGIVLILDGISFFLLENQFIKFIFLQAWPIFLINMGIALIPANFYKYKRASTALLIPAAVIIVLGVVILLFSTHIIKVPFVKFISISWPVILALGGIFLIVLFFVLRKNSNKIVYFQDDTTGIDDEVLEDM